MSWNKDSVISDLDLGIDIVLKKKFAKVSLNQAKRILTSKEFDKFILFTTRKQKMEYLASRWAAKEAIFKALPQHSKINLFTIEILNDVSGKPYCSNFENIRLSISHFKRYVVCCCAYLM